MKLRTVAAIVWTGSMLAAGTAWSATDVGVTSAVLPQAEGTPPGAITRILQIGEDVVADERVTTSEKGKLQILFVDGSALTLGPNSDVVIDSFVYDAEAKTGELAMSATKGLFRLVGGRISKTKPITLNTPTALIGIRGGIMTARVGEQQTTGTFHFGDEMTMESGGQQVRVERPGFQVTAQGGNPPSPPQPVSDQAMAEDLGGFESSQDQADESGVDVADEDVAGTQLADLGSNVTPDIGGSAAPVSNPSRQEDNAEVTTASQQQVLDNQTGGLSSNSFVGRGKFGTSTTFGTSDTTSSRNIGLSTISISGGRFTSSAGSLGSFNLQFPTSSGDTTLSGSNTTPHGTYTSGTVFRSATDDFVLYELTGSRELIFAGIPTEAAKFPSTGVTTYTVRDDFTLGGSKIPIIPHSLGGDLTPNNPAQAQIYWGTGGASGVYPALFLGTVAFVGTGSTQKQAGSLIVGNLPKDSNNLHFFRGHGAGTSLTNAVNDFRFFLGAMATSDAGPGQDFFGSSGPDYAVLEAKNIDMSDVASSSDQGIDIEVGGVELSTPAFPNIPLLRTDNKSGVGDLRTEALLNFYTGGIARDFSSGGTFFGAHKFFTAATTSTTTIDGATVPLNRVRTRPLTNAVEVGMYIDSPFSDGIQNTSFTLGSLTSSPHSAFIDNGHYGAIQDASSADVGLLRNIHIDLSALRPSGVSACTCSFVHWGFWGAQVDGSTRHDIGLTPWVAAERLPSSGYINGVSGSFAGEAIGTVASGDHDSNGTVAIYTALGSYSFDVSISGGVISVSNGSMSIDGASLTFTGSGSVAGGATEFSGSMSGTRGAQSLSGQIRGGFAGAPIGSRPPQNSFGHFAADYGGSDPQYQISGIHKSELQP